MKYIIIAYQMHILIIIAPMPLKNMVFLIKMFLYDYLPICLL